MGTYNPQPEKENGSIKRQSTPNSKASVPVQDDDIGFQAPAQFSMSFKGADEDSKRTFAVSPQDIMLIPVQRALRTIRKSDRRRRKTAILTSSNNKLELELEGKKD